MNVTPNHPVAPAGAMCQGCGTQFAGDAPLPAECPICADDRQYVPGGIQRWTSHTELAATHTNRVEDDDGLLGVGIREPFAIPQRALLVRGGLNVLWDCVSLVTPAAVRAVEEAGGLDAIAISHPHFYSSMVEWSEAFGGVPIYLHAADSSWVQRRSSAIRWWSGDDLDLAPDLRLIHLPGHFPGSAVLHVTDHQRGASMLLAGDSLHVADDRAHVTVMHSVPNFLPVGPAVIDDVRSRLDGVDFDDLYGFTWGRNILGGARAAVDESLDRYRRHVTAPAPAA